MWLERNGEWIQRDTTEPWVTKGFTVKTDQERSDYLAAQAAAAAAAAAEQAALAAMPVQFPAGVAVPIPDSNGHWMLLQPIASGEPVIALQASHSPLNPGEWRPIADTAMVDYLAERTARQQALDAGFGPQQLQAFKDFEAVDVDALFPALTAPQRRFLKIIQKGLVALGKREVPAAR